MAILRVVDGDKHFDFDLSGAELTVGRQGCDIELDQRKASRRHCKLEKVPEGWKVTDLGSSNGTYVNGQKVTEKVLRFGDTIRVASAELTYASSPSGVATPAADSVSETVDAPMDAATPAAAHPYLECRRGEFLKKQFDLSPDAVKYEPFVIGRGHGVTVRIVGDGKISSRHAEIKLEKGTYFLTDLDSSNGTKLNGKKVTFRPLTHGDVVEVGEQEFVFQDPSQAKAIRFVLRRETGKGKGESTQIIGKSFSIGRSLSNDFMVQETGVSASHCVVVQDDDGCRVRDSQSTHGTWVNDERVLEHPLAHGDRLRIGETVFTFLDIQLPPPEAGKAPAGGLAAPVAAAQPETAGGVRVYLLVGVAVLLLAGVAYALLHGSDPEDKGKDIHPISDAPADDAVQPAPVNGDGDDPMSPADPFGEATDAQRERDAREFAEFQHRVESMVDAGRGVEAYQSLLDRTVVAANDAQRAYCRMLLSQIEASATEEMDKIKTRAEAALGEGDEARRAAVIADIETFLEAWQGVLAVGSLQALRRRLEQPVTTSLGEGDETRAAALVARAEGLFRTGDLLLATIYVETVLHDYPTTRAYVDANALLVRIQQQQRANE